MAPDKIYLSVDRTGDWKYALWSIEIPTPQERELNELDKHEEYIRKDALLDKLNRALKPRGDGNPNSNVDGIQTIKAMINYIESL